MKRKALLFVLLIVMLPGCAFLNLSLLPGTKPLEETVIEGEGRTKILLIDLNGTISFKDETDRLGLGKKPSKVAFFKEALRKAEKDDDIAGVIVRINSPGGGVSASDTIYHEIMSFKHRRKIPVDAYIMSLAASGGYYVASACDRIVATPTAITGSIGVIAMKINVEGLLSKIGVSNETFKSGPKKDFWSPFRPSTPEEKKMLQDIIDRLYARFLAVVLESRQKILTEQEVRNIADGRVLVADEALKAGLIDRVSYLDDEIHEMKKRLNAEHAKVVTYIRPGNFKSTVYSEMPLQAPQTVNLISIDAAELELFSGVRFLYLWNP